MLLRRVTSLIYPLKSFNIQRPSILTSFELNFSTSNVKKCSEAPQEASGKKTMSKAMKAYLERAKEHDAFMAEQKLEFQIGKRHLANMMGENPDTFTQNDIDNAIEYLFPSGLFEKKARPLMKPPEEVFPQRKAAEFDETGRPFHFLFYTGKPNFYQVLYDMVENMNELNKYEDAMIRKGLKPDETLKIDTSGYQWIDKKSFEEKLVETIQDREYDNFINALERLITHPYSHKVKDYIDQYRKPLVSQTETLEAPKPQFDEDGRAFITVYEARRKKAVAQVTIKCPGTGQISINNTDINYFKDSQSREQLLFPLIFTGMQNKIDIEAKVEGGGYSGQAGAVRWGISWGLRSFVDQDTIEKMRLAGLLTMDVRTRERKKYGQQGARRKFTWKKR